MKLSSLIIKAAFTLIFASSLTACKSTDINSLLTESINSDLRSEKNKNRDQYRHPRETLNFFGLQPNMTVVEIWPGSGWYSEILAPVLNEEGNYYVANFPSDSEVKYYQRALQNYKDKLATDKVYNKVQISEFYPGSHHAIAPEASADMVLTFRNLHNWYMQRDNEGVENAFKAFYAALKPGGILGLVDHRLPEERHSAKAKRSGYVKESWVIALAKKAGFVLVEKSEINANQKDTADHKKGVWTLPPRLASGETDTNKYLAIGESDRMTLKFKKPLAKP